MGLNASDSGVVPLLCLFFGDMWGPKWPRMGSASRSRNHEYVLQPKCPSLGNSLRLWGRRRLGLWGLKHTFVKSLISSPLRAYVLTPTMAEVAPRVSH